MTRLESRLSRRAALLALGAAPCPAAWAGSACDSPLKIVVPFQAGGAGDAAARAVAASLATRIGLAVVVENKPGADGAIGARFAARAAPDGCSLFLGHTDTLVLNRIAGASAESQPSFDPVAFIGTVPGVLVARPGLGARTGRELLRAARAKPGAITFGTWGIGSSAHLGALLLEQSGGVEFLMVPFQGTPAVATALLAGQIDLAFLTAQRADEWARAGRVAILGTMSPARLRQAPDIPTLSEQGFPGASGSTWYGFMAPRGTPLRVRQELNAAIDAALREPGVDEALRASGFEVDATTIDAFARFIESDAARWARLIQDRGIAPGRN